MKRLVVVVALMGLASTAFAQQPEVVEFYGKDVVGSIRIVYDASGNIVGRQDSRNLSEWLPQHHLL